MNAPAPAIESSTLSLRDLAFGALGGLLQSPGRQGAHESSETPEARFLQDAWQRCAGPSWPHRAQQALLAPAVGDVRLLRAAELLRLTPVEVLAVALAAGVEEDPLVARLVAWLQAPAASPRPSLALLARALTPMHPAAADGLAEAEAQTLYVLAFGAATRAGLLLLDGEERPLCERGVRIASALAAALAGIDAEWPGALDVQVAVSEGLDDGALHEWALRLAASPRAALLIRSASPAEAQAVALSLAGRLGARPAWFGAELPPGADLWLTLMQRLPVFALDGAPGDVLAVPALRHYHGPVLVTGALDGGVRRDDGVLAEWRVPRAALAERQALWCAALGDDAMAAASARAAAQRYRGGPAQVAEHARLSRLLAGRAAHGADLNQAIVQAARSTTACRALDALAQALPEAIADDALVVVDSVRDELARVQQRCEQREALHRPLGPAARSRSNEGVRMLFTGASGTGKSLAAQWLASRLGLPVYRVDLSSMLSKWIGETEKNLAELLARAEHADVLLLFDEADTLFGKRTEVASANDRFANAQTNYLLQRIETHAGIVVLTSNSRSRFDPAFTRRLDFIVDFSAPDAQARRDLWLAHLGSASDCDATQINRLAALADLAGGNIRNAVFAAAARAAARAGTGSAKIGFDDIADGVRSEYRKLGRTPPLEL